jgi:hypothetical protein
MNIVQKIKIKKELKGLSDSYVESVVHEIMRKKQLSYKTAKDEKEIIKLARAELRLKTGRFTITSEKSDDIVQEHSSTRERLDFYPVLLKKIKSLDHRSILDLGCGINPLMFGTITKKYYAYDIDQSALNIVSKYFSAKAIAGHVYAEDITKVNSFPHSDIALLFKILDVIEKKGHKKAEELLLKINSKHIIISFSTRTLSNAPMNHPQRGWIEKLLTRLGYTFETLSSKNEIFYVASKM